MNVQNNVSQVRKKHALSVAQTASLVGVTRQTIYAIEAGSYIPNTLVALKLAAAFDVAVEDLFFLDTLETDSKRYDTAQVYPGAERPCVGQPVRLIHVGDRLVATDLNSSDGFRHPADGIVVKTEAKSCAVTVQTFSPRERLQKRLSLIGDDPALAVLAHHLQLLGTDLIVTPQVTAAPIDLIERGLAHIACHCVAVDPFGRHTTFFLRKVDLRKMAVITCHTTEIGLVLAPGNPKAIRAITDLKAHEAAIVNREPGTEARRLLDKTLQMANIKPNSISGYAQVVQGHLPAAWHVFMKKADACLATRKAAAAFGLDFVMLAKRKVSFVLRKDMLKAPQIVDTVETLRKANFRHELELCCGCNAETAGTFLDTPPTLKKIAATA